MAADPFRLEGKVALVTGASSGLGRRFATALDGAGARVVVAARRVDRLEALADELTDAVAVACDLADPASIDALAATALDRCGRVDVLVNNAGMGDPMPAEVEPMDVFRRIVDVNLTGQFQLTQLLARPMLERGDGVIVNVASVLGLVASGQIPQVSYVATKHAMVGVTRELAVQWARRGVRVNALAPGWFDTEMTGEMFADEGGQRWIRRNTPMGRGGELDELDGALLYLCSDASRYVTGQVLAVDGGWTAR